jgi:hypothetical protein
MPRVAAASDETNAKRLEPPNSRHGVVGDRVRQCRIHFGASIATDGVLEIGRRLVGRAQRAMKDAASQTRVAEILVFGPLFQDDGREAVLRHAHRRNEAGEAAADDDDICFVLPHIDLPGKKRVGDNFDDLDAEPGEQPNACTGDDGADGAWPCWIGISDYRQTRGCACGGNRAAPAHDGADHRVGRLKF